MKKHEYILASFLSLACWFFILISAESAFADPVNLDELTPGQQALINEHVYGGLPSSANIYVRNGYILSYNPMAKTPDWVAYHIKPDYRNTPKRKGRYKTFRKDPDIDGEPSNSDYIGLYDSRGYARGHLAPYGIMGGDRDGDGSYAGSDPDDDLTVFQGNYMTNIAPQHHKGFNGSPGLWWTLERWIQDELVQKQGREVWIFAGCIFGPGEHEKVTDKDVWVPPMFYKIVIIGKPDSAVPYVLAFLFPHQRKAHGQIANFLVTVDVIEALTGEDFFSELEDASERQLEDRDTWETWLDNHYVFNDV
jgi:endonuclease G, mitochondrial